MSTEFQRTCPSCGYEFSGAMEFCPVCMLRNALAGGVEPGESTSEEAVKPTPPEQAVQRFEHYELAMGEDGKPIELGRGAMGVTYKAFDTNLHCPVTLKVISERYLDDETVRLRFLRERALRQGCGIQTLPRCCTLAEPVRATFTRWSLWREKRSMTSSNVQAGWR